MLVLEPAFVMADQPADIAMAHVRNIFMSILEDVMGRHSLSCPLYLAFSKPSVVELCGLRRPFE